MQNNNPLSPHLQVYKWQISSLLSITHRIVGVINFIAITIICFWSVSLLLGQTSYQFIQTFLNSIFGKFLVISLCWTFSFHILNEVRHLFWDAGYGFDLKIAKITGVITLFGSFVLTILFYILGRHILKCIIPQKNGFLQKLVL
jgi:succinate dehydrogenase / fumarate reductase cytochrome b subunit